MLRLSTLNDLKRFDHVLKAYLQILRDSKHSRLLFFIFRIWQKLLTWLTQAS